MGVHHVDFTVTKKLVPVCENVDRRSVSHWKSHATIFDGGLIFKIKPNTDKIDVLTYTYGDPTTVAINGILVYAKWHVNDK